MASQLRQWRGMLPPDIQWAEDDPTSYPSPQQSASGQGQALDPSLPAQAGSSLFTADLDSDAVQYPYAFDVQVALLRTRYYYAKYMVYRPFVYKALHFPGEMSQDDVMGVVECLNVCLFPKLT